MGKAKGKTGKQWAISTRATTTSNNKVKEEQWQNAVGAMPMPIAKAPQPSKGAKEGKGSLPKGGKGKVKKIGKGKGKSVVHPEFQLGRSAGPGGNDI